MRMEYVVQLAKHIVAPALQFANTHFNGPIQTSSPCTEVVVDDLARRNPEKNCSALGRKAKKAATRTMTTETGAAMIQKDLWVRFETLMSLVFIPR